jgi:CHAT domain-containing protein/Tfp pilus assembly protein PilF
MSVKPVLAVNLTLIHDEAARLRTQGDLNGAAEKWRLAAEAATQFGQVVTAAWFLTTAAGAFSEAGRATEAARAYRDAVNTVGPSAPRLGLHLRALRWEWLVSQRNWRDAEQLGRAILAELEASERPTLAVATALELMSRIARGRPDQDLAAAEDYFRRSLEIRRVYAPNTSLVSVSLIHLASIARARRRLDAAAQYATEAVELLERIAPRTPDHASALEQLGFTARAQREYERAEQHQLAALAIYEGLGDARIDDVIRVLFNLHNIADDQGRPSADRAYLSRRLAILERHAPESGALAETLSLLGELLGGMGELAQAQEHLERALSIQQAIAADTVDVAGILDRLAGVESARGDVPGALKHITRAVRILERVAPESTELIDALIEEGVVEWRRGDLARSEERFRRALQISERIAPESYQTAYPLCNLGSLSQDRSDWAAAEAYYGRCLALFEKLKTSGPQLVGALSNLGLLALRQGDLDRGEAQLLRALDLLRQAKASGEPALVVYHNLAMIARERGDLDSTEQMLRQALAALELEAPGSRNVAQTTIAMGDVLFARGDYTAAREWYERAFAALGNVFAGTTIESEALFKLGTTARQRGTSEIALDYFRRSLHALEQQEHRLGAGDEALGRFGTQHREYYDATIDLLVRDGRQIEAFQIHERSRARSLLRMLTQRELTFSRDMPADLQLARRQNIAEYDLVQRRLGERNATKDEVESTRLQLRLSELRREREVIASQVRQASPRYATLQYPQPLDLAGAGAALDPGTVLLSYSVGEDKTLLFVVQAPQDARATPGLTAITLPLGDKALRDQISDFRQAVLREGAAALERGLRRQGAGETTLAGQGKRLYDLLIKPAERLIGPAARVLISPDGPLHALPFAALVRKTGRNPTYFVQWKPLHVVVSATVYAELRRARTEPRNAAGPSLVAFGDPVYPDVTPERLEQLGDPEVRATVRRGPRLIPLPATGREVRAIGQLYGTEAQVFVQGEATEERAKTVGQSARYLHFASHGILDERFPLNSGLALSIPEKPVEGQDNGLLQAWEIFDHVRIDANLVTLSACETGLGAEMGGEGLVGLVRAFQYAGARSVAASLWSVADESTATLMTNFYTALRQGKPKDEALRAAQLALIKNKRTASPFYWAAFQLYGDWR